MARNGSGTYSVPNTAVAGTTITSSDYNENFTDLGSEITNSIAADGQSSMSAPLKLSSGTVSLPSWCFSTDTNTGGYRPAADEIGLACGGNKIVGITSTGISVAGTGTFSGVLKFGDGTVLLPGLAFGSDTNSGFYPIGADNIGLALNGAKVVDYATTGIAITGTLSSTGVLTSAAHVITSASATALTVGLNGSTNPALLVDASTATSATGVSIKSAAAAGGVAIAAISSGSNENLKIDAKGSGTVTIAGTSTGAVAITPATTITGALTANNAAGIAAKNTIKASASIVAGVGPTVTEGFNTASVVRSGTGDYTVTFTNALSTANFQPAVSPEFASGACYFAVKAKTTTTLRIAFRDGGGAVDPDGFSFLVTGA